MIKKIIHIICLLGLTISSSLAQSDSDYIGLKFDAQPKHQSELGISVGNFMVLGDILPQASWGAGFHFRKAIDYAFSWRLDALYGVAKGLEPRNSGGSTSSAAAANYVLNGSLNNGINYTTKDWYHNYQTKFISLTLQGVWSLNSFNFKKQTRKTNIYLLGGLGVNSFKAYYDAKNSSGVQHDFDQIGDNLDTDGSRTDRKTAMNRIKDILDGDYETRAEIASGRRNNNDPESFYINFHANAGLGVSFKVNENFNISIEQQMTFVFGNEADLLDGHRWRNSTNLTQNIDVASYTSISFNFNIGKKESRSEPLWWVSPLSLMAEDLAEVKARPVFDTTDNDNDGVVDILDDELDTPEGFPVDTHGVQLDSDSDGVVDGNDKEPYSPSGYNVDAEGIAQVPAPDYINTADVIRKIDEKRSENSNAATFDLSGYGLPKILFDMDQYDIKDSELGILRTIAGVMKNNPNKRVVVAGHTNYSVNKEYNDVLSYKRAEAAINYIVNNYGVARDRLILKWSDEGDNFCNGCVEFRVATTEVEEGRPECLSKDCKELLAKNEKSALAAQVKEDQIWMFGYNKINTLTPGEVYTFKLEIIQGKDTKFQHLDKTREIIQRKIKGEVKGEKIAIEFKSPDSTFVKIDPNGKDERNIGNNIYWIWDLTSSPLKSGLHEARVQFYTRSNNDTTSKPIDDEEIKFEIVRTNDDVVTASNDNMAVNGDIRKTPLWVWLLIPAAFLLGFFFFFFFYKRKEKQKAEEKEKVFPDTAIVFLEEVKHIIGDGDTDTAIQKLLQYFEEQENLHDELIQLRAQYQHYKSQQRKGLLEPSDNITLNRINNAIIELINESKNKLAIN